MVMDMVDEKVQARRHARCAQVAHGAQTACLILQDAQRRGPWWLDLENGIGGRPASMDGTLGKGESLRWEGALNQRASTAQGQRIIRKSQD